ncbi:MAG: hypothetical protein N2689_00840 [Verrucomicrobiae bacterium]|nr:hypothetical protein [Verrucomicrobiae bacterium]
MKIETRFRGMNGRKELRYFLKEQIAELAEALPVTSALVVVERQSDMAPSYWIYVRLAVPGKDLFACGRDHTPLGAWLKARHEVNREIKRRKARLVAKRKSNIQLRGATGRRANISASHRA